MLTEQEFKVACDQALESLYKSLVRASEESAFDPDMNSGALSISFEETSPLAKFVISPQTPVRQIWVSAQSKSFKFDWNVERGKFVLPGTGQSLKEMLSAAITQQLGDSVEL